MAAAFLASLLLPPLLPHAASTVVSSTAAVRDPSARFMKTSLSVGGERVNPGSRLDQQLEVPQVAPPHPAEQGGGGGPARSSAHPRREGQVLLPSEGGALVDRRQDETRRAGHDAGVADTHGTRR